MGRSNLRIPRQYRPPMNTILPVIAVQFDRHPPVGGCSSFPLALPPSPPCSGRQTARCGAFYTRERALAARERAPFIPLPTPSESLRRRARKTKTDESEAGPGLARGRASEKLEFPRCPTEPERFSSAYLSRHRTKRR